MAGDPSSTSFDLEIDGRGFGLSHVVYDLGDGTGTSSTVDLSIRISTRNGGFARVFGRRAITVQSPRRMVATIQVDAPLPSGIYSLEIFDGDDPLAEEPNAFEIDGDVPPPDAGVDGGMPPDAGRPDTGAPDAGPMDADVDAGTPDTGPPDTGLPFVGNYGFRRPVNVGSTVEAPSGATLIVPIPHATYLAAGQSKADATDLKVYQGQDPLDFQWADRFAVGTDGLRMVVRLGRAVPPGGDPADPLLLYYGDPAAANVPTEGVFAFVERFAQEVSPIEQGNANAWSVAQNWIFCRADRPAEAIQDPAGSYCAVDANGGLVRQTIATPRQIAMSNTPGPNLVYEMSVWMAGRTADGNEDIIYFSYGADNETYEDTVDLDPVMDWVSFPPNGTLTFTDTDDQPRTVNGWRFAPDQLQWWDNAVARFVPTIDQPSLHFRNVSTDNADNNSASIIDDWWVRLAVDPAPTITLGPEEAAP